MLSQNCGNKLAKLWRGSQRVLTLHSCLVLLLCPTLVSSGALVERPLDVCPHSCIASVTVKVRIQSTNWEPIALHKIEISKSWHQSVFSIDHLVSSLVLGWWRAKEVRAANQLALTIHGHSCFQQESGHVASAKGQGELGPSKPTTTCNSNTWIKYLDWWGPFKGEQIPCAPHRSSPKLNFGWLICSCWYGSCVCHLQSLCEWIQTCLSKPRQNIQWEKWVPTSNAADEKSESSPHKRLRSNTKWKPILMKLWCEWRGRDSIAFLGFFKPKPKLTQ